MVKKNNRPYKYNSKSRLTSTSSFPFSSSSVKKLSESKKNLENTLTKFRIDDDTLNKNETLDNTFLEGRTEKKKSKKKGRKPSKESRITFWKKVCLIISAVCAFILSLLIMVNTITQWLLPGDEDRIILEKKKNIDDNYLFVGDFYTQNFPFKEYGLDYHYVKSGAPSLTTKQLLSNMKSMVYDFNPSVVFLEVGNIDIREGVSEEEIINNYRTIIELIKNNRPNAAICVESLYPTNTYDVVLVNNRLKELCKEKNVFYIDVYSLLNNRSYYNEENLNDSGYQELYKKIKSIVG